MNAANNPPSPTVFLGDEDRTASLLDPAHAPLLRPGARAEDFPAARPTLPADALTRCADEQAYQEALITLLRAEGAVNTDAMAIPFRPGLRGRVARCVRSALWKLLRYQHDEMAARYNAAMELQAAAGQYQAELLNRRIAALECRLATCDHDT